MRYFESRKRRLVVVLSIALVAVIAVGIVGAQNRSSGDRVASTGTEAENGPASFIGHASNAVMFIQWTRSDHSVTGSLREALTKTPAGSGLSSADHAFTGVIDGSGLTLNLQRLEATAYVGEVRDNGFTLTVPGKSSSLININFEPGEVAAYDAASKELLLSEYSSPCSLYVGTHEVRVSFTGNNAAESCSRLVEKMPATEWTTTPQEAANSGTSMVCELTNPAKEHATVTDGGGQSYGQQACNQLSGEGWG